jgi:hypothetical protein
LFLGAIRLFIVNKERHIAHFLGCDQLFLRILDREDAFGIAAGAMLDPLLGEVAFLAAQQP